MITLQLPLVVSQRHSAITTPLNSSMAVQSPLTSFSQLILYLSSCFYLMTFSSYPKPASSITVNAQKSLTQRLSAGSLQPTYKSKTLRPYLSSRLVLGTITKSTVLSSQGFHLMQPLLVAPTMYSFSSWLKMMPSQLCSIIFTYFFSINYITLNLRQVSLKKSLSSMPILWKGLPSISLHCTKRFTQSKRYFRGNLHMLRPRCTKPSNIRYRKICFSFTNYWTSSPSNMETTCLRSLSFSYVLATSISNDMLTSTTKLYKVLCPFLLTKQHCVQQGQSKAGVRIRSALKTLATIRRQRTPSLFSQTRQGDYLELLGGKISVNEERVIDTGCPPKKDSYFFMLGKSSRISFMTYSGRERRRPGCSRVILVSLKVQLAEK